MHDKTHGWNQANQTNMWQLALECDRIGFLAQRNNIYLSDIQGRYTIVAGVFAALTTLLAVISSGLNDRRWYAFAFSIAGAFAGFISAIAICIPYAQQFPTRIKSFQDMKEEMLILITKIQRQLQMHPSSREPADSFCCNITELFVKFSRIEDIDDAVFELYNKKYIDGEHFATLGNIRLQTIPIHNDDLARYNAQESAMQEYAAAARLSSAPPAPIPILETASLSLQSPRLQQSPAPVLIASPLRPAASVKQEFHQRRARFLKAVKEGTTPPSSPLPTLGRAQQLIETEEPPRWVTYKDNQAVWHQFARNVSSQGEPSESSVHSV